MLHHRYIYIPKKLISWLSHRKETINFRAHGYIKALINKYKPVHVNADYDMATKLLYCMQLKVTCQ